MRKTIAAIALTLGLAVAATPAMASTPFPDCPVVGAGCPQPDGVAPEAQPWVDYLQETIHAYYVLTATQAQTIQSQQEKIARQAKVIKRLRHRLATR